MKVLIWIVVVLFGFGCALYVFFTKDYHSVLIGFFTVMTIAIVQSLDKLIGNTFAIHQELIKITELLEDKKNTSNNRQS